MGKGVSEGSTRDQMKDNTRSGIENEKDGEQREARRKWSSRGGLVAWWCQLITQVANRLSNRLAACMSS